VHKCASMTDIERQKKPIVVYLAVCFKTDKTFFIKRKKGKDDSFFLLLEKQLALGSTK